MHPMFKLTARQREAARFYYWQAVREYPEQPRSGLWRGAVRHVHFRERLSADVKAFNKRSRAARKAWKARRAKAA